MTNDTTCKTCGEGISGDEFDLSISEFPTKRAYINMLQEFHDVQSHTSKKEQMHCDECGHQSKTNEETIKHIESHMRSDA